MASMLLFAWLATSAMAALPALHELIHNDSQNPQHQCAVTALVHGKYLSHAPATIAAAPAPRVEVAAVTFGSVILPAIDYRLVPGRAPPATLSPTV